MATKKQVISTEINFLNDKYCLIFKITDKVVKKVNCASLYEAVSLRELFANLPSAKVKLALLLEDKLIKKTSVQKIKLVEWFEAQIEQLDRKAKNIKQENENEQETEEFDLDAYLSKFNL